MSSLCGFALLECEHAHLSVTAGGMLTAVGTDARQTLGLHASLCCPMSRARDRPQLVLLTGLQPQFRTETFNDLIQYFTVLIKNNYELLAHIIYILLKRIN